MTTALNAVIAVKSRNFELSGTFAQLFFQPPNAKLLSVIHFDKMPASGLTKHLL
jgi:hypothetical protein